MPRYFFHLFEDMVVLDEDGQELAAVEDVRAQALKEARELIADQAREGKIHLQHRIEVQDEEGRPVFLLPFRSAIEIEP